MSDPHTADLRAAASRLWWFVVLRAVVAIVFGILVLAWPDLSLRALLFVFGFFAVIDGIVAILAGFGIGAEVASRGWAFLEGALSLVAGLVALLWPGVTALALLWVIAVWAVLVGAVELFAAFRLRGRDRGWGWTALAGALYVLLGILLMVWPVSGILSLLWLLGVGSIVWGIAVLVLAFVVRGDVKRLAA